MPKRKVFIKTATFFFVLNSQESKLMHQIIIMKLCTFYPGAKTPHFFLPKNQSTTFLKSSNMYFVVVCFKYYQPSSDPPLQRSHSFPPLPSCPFPSAAAEPDGELPLRGSADH